LGSSDSIYQTKAVGFDLAAGDYALTIDASSGATGAYSFRLLDLGQALAITPGTSVSQQALTPANSTTPTNSMSPPDSASISICRA